MKKSWPAPLLIEKNAKYKKISFSSENFDIKYWITQSKLIQILSLFFFFHFSLKYVPTVKQWINEWKKKRLSTGLIKNEIFFNELIIDVTIFAVETWIVAGTEIELVTNDGSDNVLVYTRFFYEQMFREHFDTIWEDNVRIKPPEFLWSDSLKC